MASPSDGAAPGASNDPQAETVVLASGQIALPAAGAFGEPGFHEVLKAEGQLSADAGGPGGSRLVLKLRDLNLPSGLQTLQSRTYYLSESGRLRDTPEPYSPG